MQCPKCHSDCRDGEEICPACGIVFAKYFSYHAPPPTSGKPEDKPAIRIYDADEARGDLQEFIFVTDKPVSWFSFAGRAVILLGLAIWSWRFISAPIASNYAGESFMHLINLPFHEAGHIIFRPFGAFITSLGGSLGQVLMPTLCCATLLIKTRDPFGASVALWWLGQNFLDMAPYINDARAGDLPLVGGNYGHSSPYGFHDWEYLLTESGLLQYDHALARAAFVFGSLVMLLAQALGATLLFKQYKTLADAASAI
jgi:hypothetical protein